KSSFGRSKNGSVRTQRMARSHEARLSTSTLDGKEDDVSGRHRCDGARPDRPRARTRVELEDAEDVGARSESVLGELAEVGRSFDGALDGVPPFCGILRPLEAKTFRTERDRHLVV